MIISQKQVCDDRTLCYHDFPSRQAGQEEEHDVGDCMMEMELNLMVYKMKDHVLKNFCSNKELIS